MAARLEVGWNIAVTGAHSIDVTDSGGNDVISLPSSTYCHTDISASVPGGGYADAASAWETALNASGTLDGTFTVAWSGSTLAYAIASTHAFSMAYSGAAVLRGMHSMGFAGAQGSSTAQASDNEPFYMMSFAMGAPSNVSGEYEGEDVSSESEADDGSAYVESKYSTTSRYDFEARMESLADVFISEAAGAALWTWEDLFKHVRGREPMYFAATNMKTRILQNRASGTRFRPTPVAEDWDELWNLAFQTRILATL